MNTATKKNRKSLLSRIAGAEKAGPRGGSVSPAPMCALVTGPTPQDRRGYSLRNGGLFIEAALTPRFPGCQACFGTGRRLNAASGLAEPCARPLPLAVVNAFKEAQLPGLYLEASLAGFKNLTGKNPAALTALKNWLGRFTPSGGPGLVLSGGVGVGKTYLMVAIAKHLIENGVGVRYVDFHRLLSVIRAAYADRKSEESIMAPLVNAPVLIIDELGKGRNNDWEQEKLDQIVMGRYGQGKFIIASTNYPLREESSMRHLMTNVNLEEERSSRFNPDAFESLETRIGKRIFSRLCETSLFVEMDGDDFRRRIQSRRFGPDQSRNP